MDIQKFEDYEKAVNFMLERQQVGEIWLMSVELIENKKIYILKKQGGENMKDIDILIADRCTEKEAKAALKRGTQIYDNPLEWIENLKLSGCYNDQTIENAREGKYTDVSTVIYNDHEYLIEYVN